MSDGEDDDAIDDGGPRLAEPGVDSPGADAADDGLRPGVQVPPHGRQEELPLVETLTADEAARAAEQADTITAADLPVLVPDTTALPPSELRAVVEGLLFVSTRPLSIEKLQE